MNFVLSRLVDENPTGELSGFATPVMTRRKSLNSSPVKDQRRGEGLSVSEAFGLQGTAAITIDHVPERPFAWHHETLIVISSRQRLILSSVLRVALARTHPSSVHQGSSLSWSRGTDVLNVCLLRKNVAPFSGAVRPN
jgi:hypothetical protein